MVIIEKSFLKKHTTFLITFMALSLPRFSSNATYLFHCSCGELPLSFDLPLEVREGMSVGQALELTNSSYWVMSGFIEVKTRQGSSSCTVALAYKPTSLYGLRPLNSSSPAVYFLAFCSLHQKKRVECGSKCLFERTLN